MKLFSGSSNLPLAKEISELYGIQLGKLKIEKFKDGEILPTFGESVRGEDVFILQSLYNSDSIMETILIGDAAKRSDCKSITLIAPYLAYSRADKVDHLRSSIGSKVMADMISLKYDKIITIDLHNSAITAFYDIPVIHLDGSKIFKPYIKKMRLEDLTVVSPDQGGMTRASKFAKSFPNCQLAMINKKRIRPNEIASMELIGDVTNRVIVVVDDLVDTLGTLKKASNLMKESKSKDIICVATHPVLSGDAMDNLTKSDIKELIVSNTISLENINHPKLTVISCANLIADALTRLQKHQSINELNEVE